MADPRGAAADLAQLVAGHPDQLIPVRAGDLGPVLGAALVAAVECPGLNVQAVTQGAVRTLLAFGAAIDTAAAIEGANRG